MIFFRLRRFIATLVMKASGLAIVAIVLLYGTISWWLLYLAGESPILPLDIFIYWLMVTGSTVGYGDYSPVSSAGRWIVSLWVIPLGLTLFGLVVARAGWLVGNLFARGKRGLRMLDHENHTVIIGWNGARTLHLVQLLRERQKSATDQIVLCVTDPMENPLPDQIDFVRTDSFVHPEGMARAALEKAARVIIDTPQDDVTLTTALYCAKKSPQSHQTAYLQDEEIGALLRQHCPQIELVPSVAVEMLAKSSLDPGSSQLHKQLLDSTEGMTQYSASWQGKGRALGDFFSALKQSHDATLIGILRKAATQVEINPSLNSRLEPGDQIYYISDQRLPDSFFQGS